MKNFDYQAYLDDLEEAIYWHQDWVSRLHRCMIFKSGSSEDFAVERSDHQCKFGRWFYNTAAPEEYAELLNIVKDQHEQLHEAAYILVRDFHESGHANADLFDELDEIRGLFFGSLYTLYKALTTQIKVD